MKTSYIVILVITPVVTIIFYNIIRFYLIAKRGRIVAVKKNDLIDFLNKYQRDLYPLEIIQSMDNLKEMEERLKVTVGNYKKNRKPELKKARDEAYTKASGLISLDLLGILNFAAQKDIDFHLNLQEKTLEMEIDFLKARMGIAHSELLLGGLFPEAKKRLDLLQICQDYLKEEIHFCNYLEMKKENAMLERHIQRIRYFLVMLQVPQLHEFFLLQPKQFKKSPL